MENSTFMYLPIFYLMHAMYFKRISLNSVAMDVYE